MEKDRTKARAPFITLGSILAIFLMYGYVTWTDNNTRDYVKEERQQTQQYFEGQKQELESEIFLSRDRSDQGRAILYQQLYSQGGTNQFCEDPKVAALVDKSKAPATPNSKGTNLGVGIMCERLKVENPDVYGKFKEDCEKALTP